MQSPDYYQFFSQAKIISGNKAMAQIPIDLDGYGAGRPLVLAGRDVKEKYLVKFQKALCETNVVIGALYNEIGSNPEISLIKKLSALYTWKECDSIIVIGGGSAMDVAKVLSIAVSYDGDIMSFSGEDNVPGITVPLFYVATTDVNGYESSNSAIIDNILFKSNYIYADEICIDSSMVKCGDAGEIVESSLVALSNCIEAAASSFDDPMTDAYAYTAMQFIYENLFTLQKKTWKKKPAMTIANAIAGSGIVFSNSPEGVIHSLVKELSLITGESEGVLKGIILPYALKYKLSSKEKVRNELLLAIAGLDIYAATPDKEKAGKGVELISQFIEKFDKYIPATLKDLNIPEYKLESVVETVCGKSKAFDKKGCIKILESAWKGSL